MNDASGIVVREFLKRQEISKVALTDIKFGGGNILVNDVPVTVRYVLKEGDVLKVHFPPEKRSGDLLPENIQLCIIYEDDYILVINKPPFMSVIPSREHPTGSLANAILYYYEKNNISSTVHIVNRLDRDTSGLLIVAKHRYTHHLFSKVQKVSGIKRRYEAFVHGIVEEDHKTIHAPIGRKDDSIIEREVRDDGQVAITHFDVFGRYKDLSHVSLKLETGRTHQIRVHMAYLGHPLIGDDLYGGSRKLMNRQALHSTELSFVHPITKEHMYFEIPLPLDMNSLL
ncbi:RluA family pseudouridine synthase [Bacillus suaedaesalsae]|uniref:Pseudouridine synthase n=1 Tax=Bacillus suaedaesalsae TaxID=2810349 RepID=A0ABS2DIC8_9BACI|nr:RluA family pseudouridine synthase [Bacillus suaedaesalsae]MBM6618257.1 RluA family pseudouridine synthase [Bacillus suaedaesalsae]